MTGVVTASREATIIFSVRSAGGGETPIEAVIDTGFNGYLTLPAATISALGLAARGIRSAMLGDGSTVALAVYRADVVWDGLPRPVQVLAAEGSPLVGMRLLQGYRVSLDVTSGGSVMIEALP